MKKAIFVFSLCVVFHTTVFGQSNRYPEIVDDQLVIQGDKCGWDVDAVHTFSIVEANKDGYKYWGYYGLDHYQNDVHLRKAGIARSNNLLDWDKYEGNPIIATNCRWPTVILYNNKFYMFYAEYKKANGDSRIVMAESDNGIDFENKRVVVPYADGHQNQNPFIYFNKNDGYYYLFYYNGTEQAKVNPRWNIHVKKCKDLADMPVQQSYEVLSSSKTLAAPSVAYYNGTYYLLVEEFADDTHQSWVTNAFSSMSIDKGYERVANNPILYKNDACAFQYVLDGHLYVTYSHCLNINKGNWVMRMMKAK
ncbi:hypothetical protein D7D25_13975 [Proteiniphilum sp. X52]|nr:hypothetical protein D7D25_13975 [Proteiniphilum sp. X52]